MSGIINGTQELKGNISEQESLQGGVALNVNYEAGGGQDGFSPIATVTQTEEGALIEITDKNGKTSATVEHGQDGQNGQDGKDGFSPTITTSEGDGVTYLYIVDKNGLQPPIFINDGKDGFSPLINVSTLPNGYLVLIQTKDGSETMEILNGEDGVSPLVSVSEGNGGHSVTIQDRFGDNTFFVADGEDGYTPQKNFDYFDGKDGVGIENVITLVESQEDEGTNFYEIVLTNGIRKQFRTKNGSKGSQGEKGSDATVTSTNIKNALGYTPSSFSGSYNDLTNKPTIPTVPTKVSAFENDKGYITLNDLPLYNGGVS